MEELARLRPDVMIFLPFFFPPFSGDECCFEKLSVPRLYRFLLQLDCMVQSNMTTSIGDGLDDLPTHMSIRIWHPSFLANTSRPLKTLAVISFGTT